MELSSSSGLRVEKEINCENFKRQFYYDATQDIPFLSLPVANT